MESEKIANCLQDIINETELYEDYVSTYLMDKTFELYDYVQTCTPEIIEYICDFLLENLDRSKIYTSIWIYSFVVDISKKPTFLEEMVRLILDTPRLKANTCYFLYYRVKAIIFLTPTLDTQELQYLKWKLLYKAFHLFEKEMDTELDAIPIEERDPNMALVICEQMLVVQHGPTKTALDRCYTLIKRMKKNVLLINSAEVLSSVGEIPFWKKTTANYNEDIKTQEYLKWKDCKVPYLQCDEKMPDINVLKYLVTEIRNLKPSIVVSIGGSSILAGLVNKMVSVLTVGLTTSGIEPSLTDYQIVPPSNGNIELNLLNRMGINSRYAIEGRFTFSLKPQDEVIKREELEIAENDFVIVLVGARLDYELSDELLLMLGKLQDIPIKIVIMGVLNRFDELQEKYPWFKQNVLYLGMCKDVLSRLEICNIYVNPNRKGGGTSCVEAMYKGLPVVTTAYGDVAGIVGGDFSCSDYAEMEKLIRRYYTDKEFYKEQSDKALKLAAEYLDTEQEFERCVNIYLERIMEDK